MNIAALRRCEAVHLRPTATGHEELAWHPSQRFSRSRVVAWTCARCRFVSYELCEVAGLGFIRRTVNRQGRREVTESDAWPSVQAREMWSMLVNGWAR